VPGSDFDQVKCDADVCRNADSPKAQLQTFGKTRFSSFAILIQSLQLHRVTLEDCVKAPQYATSAAKALRRGVYTPPEEEGPKDLVEAEAQLEGMECGLYNTRAVPDSLAGNQKYARIYLDVTSPRFWDALQVSCFASLGRIECRQV
jgi:hypothetical protein